MRFQDIFGLNKINAMLQFEMEAQTADITLQLLLKAALAESVFLNFVSTALWHFDNKYSLTNIDCTTALLYVVFKILWSKSVLF